MKLPEDEEADPYFVYTLVRADGDFVRLGDLRIETSNDPLDRRVSVSVKIQTDGEIDFSEGFLRELSVLILHRTRTVEAPASEDYR